LKHLFTLQAAGKWLKIGNISTCQFFVGCFFWLFFWFPGALNEGVMMMLT